MTKNVIVIEFGKTIVDAAKAMKKGNIGSIVVTKEGIAKGIITERDIVHKVIAANKSSEKMKVESVMSTPLRVVTPDTTLEDAAKAMRKNRIKRLPVVNKKNELVGIISEGDISRIFPSIVDLIEEKAVLEK